MITNDKGIVELKHYILREICRMAWNDELSMENLEKLVYDVSPGPKPQYRCCIYKERERDKFLGRMKKKNLDNSLIDDGDMSIDDLDAIDCDIITEDIFIKK